jgi:hypothetical protein
MKIITTEKFTQLVESIQNYSYIIPQEDSDADTELPEDGSVHHHNLVVAEESDPNFFLINGKSICKATEKALAKLYPGLDDEERMMFCIAVPGYLEKHCVLLEYIENAALRRYFMRKILTTEEQLFLDNSIARPTNIRNIFSVVQSLSIKNKRFNQFIDTLFKAYNIQLREIDHEKNVITAKKTRQIVYDFCVWLIKEAARK